MTRTRPARKDRRARLALEALEGRLAPADLNNFLTTEHVEPILTYNASTNTWTLPIQDTDHSVLYDPDDALLYVGAPSLTARPAGSEFDFIGVAAGQNFYRLPQSQDPELLYAGFAAYGATSGDFDRYNPSTESKGRVSGLGRWLKVSLVGVQHTTPSGAAGSGKFSLWQSEDSGPNVFMSNHNDGVSNPNGNGLDTTDGISADDALWITAGGHLHYNWGFTQKGRYAVTFRLSGYAEDGNTTQLGTPIQSGNFTVFFSVGNVGQVALSAATYNVNENAGTATITVNRTGGSDGRITVNYATSNGTATAGSDYTSASGTLTFNDQETSKTFNVPIIDDGNDEPNETINLTISQPGPSSINSYLIDVEGDANGLLGGQTTATLTIIDNDDPPNQPPTITAIDDTSTDEDTPRTVNFTIGDDVTPVGNLTVEATSSNPTLVPNTTGNLTLGGSGASRSLLITPAADRNGQTTITVRVTDGSGQSTTEMFVLTVNAINDAPVALGDPYEIEEDGTLNVTAAAGVLNNDTDADGDVLTAELVADVTNGTLTLNGNGSFSYVPDQEFSGTDSFTYRAKDASTSSATVTVTITVGAVNDPPVANNDGYSMNEGGTLTVDLPADGVLDNDSDAEGDSFIAVLVAGPSNGVLDLNDDGTFSYTPAADFFGSATFTYRAVAGGDQSNVATVTITVNNTPDAPTATGDSYSVNEDATLNVLAADGVLKNDGDVDNDVLTAVLVSDVTHGTLTLNGNGSFSYVPDQDFSGTDSFTYRATDGSLQSGIVTVTITVNAVNDAPVAVEDAFAVSVGDALRGNVLANDADVDSSSLTASLVSGATRGTLSFAGGAFTYVPGANFSGSDSFSYRASDGGLSSDVVTVTISALELPPFEAVIGEGHADIGIAFEDDAFEPHVHDETTDAEYEPDGALFVVHAAAETTRPADPAFDFVGVAAGETFWRLPAVQRTELVLLGLGAEEIEEGVFEDDEVFLRLVAVAGPGHFSAWDSTDSGPDVLLATTDGVTDADVVSLLAGSHRDVNFGFSEAGDYAITLVFYGTLVGEDAPTFSEQVTYFIRNYDPNSISGTVFNDANGDGTQGGGETGIVGVTVTLDRGADGTIDATTSTGADGAYSFPQFDFVPGTYRVRQVTPAGRVQTTPAPADVVLTSATAADVDFGSQTQTVTVTAGAAIAAEGGAAGSFVVTRDSAAGSLTVNYTVGGSATPGADYQALSGTAVIPAGSTSVQLFVTAINDPSQEGDETVTLSLAAGSYVVGTPAAATVTVTSDDGANTDAPVVTLPGVATVAAGGAVAVLGPSLNPQATLTPFAGFTGSLNTAAGDLNGDGVADVVVSVSLGAAPHVMAFDGATGALLASFYAFDAGFLGGVSVAVGDVNGDGQADLIVGAGAGTSPHVKVIDGTKLSQTRPDGVIADSALLSSYLAFAPGFAGGLRVASGDVDGDGVADVLVASAQGVAHLKAFDAAARELASFLISPPAPGAVLSLAAGDLDGDGRAEFIAAYRAGQDSGVFVFDAAGLATADFVPFVGYQGLLTVAAMDAARDGRAEIVAGAFVSGGVHAKEFSPALTPLDSLFVQLGAPPAPAQTLPPRVRG